jgi:hypothetical protein
LGETGKDEYGTVSGCEREVAEDTLDGAAYD